ncbi:MAG: DUF2142 domain-containing protein [Candidatus Roizmanbacteria bacterium]|nr:DUF2142 domain-containing protein [Candidatus Roizmanbacteria bacterium]
MFKRSLNKMILYILIPIQLFIFTFLVPPFQKPDEQAHFEQSLIISKGFVSCDKKSNNTMPIEKKYVDFIKTPYLDLLTHGKGKLPVQMFLKDLFFTKQNNQKINFNINHLCSFPIVSYLPQAFVLTISSLIKLNPVVSLYLGRLFMAVLGYLWFLYLFKKITKNYKLILLFTFALPMTLHQISSLSYDMIHIMLGLTFFTLIVNNRVKDVMNHAPTKYFKMFFVLFLFLLSKKIGYEAFILFLFLIPFEIKPMIFSSLIFGSFLFISKLNGFFDLQTALANSEINPLRQITFLLSNLNIINVLAATTIQRSGFYLQSLIGIFGWLEYGLDPLSYLLYGLFFIYVIFNTNFVGKYILSKKKNILLFIALFVSYLFILLLAFVFNTEKNTIVAHGVQGRYFIPFVPFIILLIAQIKYYLNMNNFHKKISFKVSPIFTNILSVLVVIYLISATFFSVFNRYY